MHCFCTKYNNHTGAVFTFNDRMFDNPFGLCILTRTMSDEKTNKNQDFYNALTQLK